MTAAYTVFPTTIGTLAIVWEGMKTPRIVRIFLPLSLGSTAKHGYLKKTHAYRIPPSPVAAEIQKIRRYCEGECVSFNTRLLDLSCCSPFSIDIYRQEQRIPRGMAMSYQGLAAAAGYDHAARTAGTAQARNPFPLIVPCHRVIRASGNIGSFQNDRALKVRLLEIDGVRLLRKGKAYYVERACILSC